MNIVFMGTAPFAVPGLDALLAAGVNVTGVVTQPDRPKGRGHKLIPCAVKQRALEANLDVFQPENIKTALSLEHISAWKPDMIIVIAYGQIIPLDMLQIPRLGCVNVHGSLLPKYRGAAPIQRALMDGETMTGITTMFMNEGMDTGDMILRDEFPIPDEADYGSLHDLMAVRGAALLTKTVDLIISGRAPRIKQAEDLATYAPTIKREDEVIHWDRPAMAIHNQIRALSPTPGAYCVLEGFKLKVYRSRVHLEKSQTAGTVTGISPDGLLVSTGAGILELLEVQREGKKRIPARDFLSGFKVTPGTVLKG